MSDIPTLKQILHAQLVAEDDHDYPDYWRISSAGYCMRYNIFKRLHVPAVPEIVDGESQKLGTFGIGHAVHGMVQSLTKNAGISVAQEQEVTAPEWDAVGHFDDLIRFSTGDLVLYDYKTVHSKALNYPAELKKTHRMQVGTYMYLLREEYPTLTLARIMEISKDDFLIREIGLQWSDELKADIEAYWTELNDWWEIYHKTGKLPPCTCEERVGSWFSTRNKYGKVWHDFFYEGTPCSQKWFDMWKEKQDKEVKNEKN